MTSVSITSQPRKVEINNVSRTLVIQERKTTVEIKSSGTQGPEGPPGPAGASFEFTQAAAATLWTIAHNLGRKPSVTTLSVGGVPMWGGVVHLSADTLTVTFLQPVAGSAHLV